MTINKFNPILKGYSKGELTLIMSSINFFAGPYRFLSNFYPAPVTMTLVLEGEDVEFTFPTAEHAYQAHKTIFLSDVKSLLWDDSPAYAKKIGKMIALRDGWENDKVHVMRAVVYAKFAQNESLRAKLIATGDAALVEGNTWNDKFWGVCNGGGQNWLGKILMDVREELSTKEE